MINTNVPCSIFGWEQSMGNVTGCEGEGEFLSTGTVCALSPLPPPNTHPMAEALLCICYTIRTCPLKCGLIAQAWVGQGCWNIRNL